MEGHDRADETGGAHTGARRVAGHREERGRDRAEDRTREGRGDPDLRVAHNIGDLQHRGTDALGNETAELVFAVGRHGKADHLSGTADDGGAGGEAGEAEGDADGGRRDGEREGEAHQDGNDNSHKQRLLLGAPVDRCTDGVHQGGDGRADEQADRGAGENGHERGDENVKLGLAGDERADLLRGKGGEKRAERFAGQSGERDGSPRDDRGGKRADETRDGGGDGDHRAALEAAGDGDADSGTREDFGKRGDRGEERTDRAGDVGGDLREDGADDEGTEKALRHCGQTVDEEVMKCL